ncbi:inner centromere isoform X1 [Pelobates cultripes]|uniref:Inner centromere isoform X1 n=1 Tax=Pelobates cultripes TaxID=61616 RepID=A0AAD1WS87_PELCU|nr:inner centromere isoform X1 [Pelobates cultripes]
MLWNIVYHFIDYVLKKNIDLNLNHPITGAIMKEMECLSNLLQACTRKTEEFACSVDDKYMVWLLEIEEEARKMFNNDFNAEPELMPKTPSQKRRRKKRTSILPDENQDGKTRRISRRKSNVSWSTSVRRLSTKYQNKPADTSIQEFQEQPKRLTRAQASNAHPPVAEKPLAESPELVQKLVLRVSITEGDRKSAEMHVTDTVPLGTDPAKSPAPDHELPESASPVTPGANSRAIGKLILAHSSTPKQVSANLETIDLTKVSPQPAVEPEKEQKLDFSDTCTTPTGSRSDRRSVRRSLVVRQSTGHHASLVSKYSLATKRDSMTRKSVRKSIRRSISKKRAAMESSASSYKSYQSSVEIVDEEVTIKIRTDPEQTAQGTKDSAPKSPRRSARSRCFNKIAISNVPESDVSQKRITRRQSQTATVEESDAQCVRRKSYKRAVDEVSDDEQPVEPELQSPPRKKTPSPPCPPSKVVKPPPHMKSFLHTVQKNQLLMMTPGSIGKNFMVKTFIKRNTPLKTDPKEKERQRLETLRKKEEAEIQRKQKIEEEKKRKQEELKIRREERLRKVLQARERVEQLEEEKKKKIEQKFAQIDEKSEKVREDRLAEEKAKKKLIAKKQEDAENRRRQEEEMRRLKTKQMEEEERRNQELLQKKREEEEQERLRKLAEAKKLAEQRQAEQEREKQREQQLAAEREQQRLKLEREKERLEKERALQLQKELERAAQEKERQCREAEERKKKELQECLEKLQKDETKEQKAVAQTSALDVTVDIAKSPVSESYEMTPKGYKQPTTKINAENYGMDLNSDDSTDDESMPRKPIPAWASGNQLAQAMRQQYFNPIDVNKLCGTIENPKLEDIFNKSKPRYFKRTSSAVWHSPPMNSTRQHLAVGYGLKKY